MLVIGMKTRTRQITATETVEKKDFTGATHKFLKVVTYCDELEKGAEETRLWSFDEITTLYNAAQDGEHIVPEAPPVEDTNVEALDQDAAE